jgi:hypothetical protein
MVSAIAAILEHPQYTGRQVWNRHGARGRGRRLAGRQIHLRHTLREYEWHYKEHRTHRPLAAAAPLRVRPQPLEPGQIERLSVDRQDRLGGVIHEYRRAA